MLNKILFFTAFVLSTVLFNNAYACQEDGCIGTVHGPITVAGVHGVGNDTYIVAIVKDTAGTDSALSSGADDEACYSANSAQFGANWLLVAPLETINKRTKTPDPRSKAMLDVLTTGQTASSTQTMLFYYTWSSAIGECVITSVGYMNP